MPTRLGMTWRASGQWVSPTSSPASELPTACGHFLLTNDTAKTHEPLVKGQWAASAASPVCALSLYQGDASSPAPTVIQPSLESNPYDWRDWVPRGALYVRIPVPAPNACLPIISFVWAMYLGS